MTTRQTSNQRFYNGLLGLFASFLVLGVLKYGWLSASLNPWTLKEVMLLLFATIGYYRWQTPCMNCRRPLQWFALSCDRLPRR